MTMVRFSGKRLIADSGYGIIQFFRNRQSIFFAFILPVLFLVLGWFLFGVPSGPDYVDYLVPGVLGIAVMAPAIDQTVGVIAGLRATGLLKKIATTPMSGLEWNLSRAVTGLSVSLFSVAASLLTAWLMFGYIPVINVIWILMVVAGSVMSVGLGMIIAYLVKDREAANMAAFTVTFPLILISGSIFPTGQLPEFLGAIVSVSPLTYVNNGLRGSMMATGNMSGAVADLAVVGLLGIALFFIGVVIQKRRKN
jgi:ABC-2 type transport system permease protein